MSCRVFVHIGTMKSGTTYIQQLFDLNQKLLAEQGVLWARSRNNFLATADLLGTRRIRPNLEGAWVRLDQQLQVQRGDAVISNELLAAAKPRRRRRLVEALQPADVRLIVTARDLGRVIPSQWQTGARNRETISWGDFITAVCTPEQNRTGVKFWRRQDIPEVVTRWSRQIPLENITVVTVPPHGAPRRTFGDRFASVLGVDIAAFQQPMSVNPSLGGYSAELLRRLNARAAGLDWHHYQAGFKNGLARLVLAERNECEPPIRLTRAQLEFATARAREMVDELADSKVRVVGDLNDLIPSGEMRERELDPAEASVAELLAAAMDGLVGVGAVLAETRIEHMGLVRRLNELLPATEEDWEAFHSHEAAQEPASTRMLSSRFLRWRLEQLEEVLVPRLAGLPEPGLVE